MNWSRTRRDLFFKCPRAWFLRYGNNTESKSQNEFLNKRRPWDLMLRAMKETLVERLEDLRQAKQWSPLLLQHQLKFALERHLQNSTQSVNKRSKEALLRYANHRFTLLWRCQIIQQLVQRKHPCWYVLDRTESVTTVKFEIYASPDLAVLIQNKWHLFRIDMQSASKKSIDELEANAMIIWAQHQGGFSQLESSYRLHTIGWRRGFWHTESFQPTHQSVEQSRQLVDLDCEAMRQTRTYGRSNLALLPLARSKKICDSCSFQLYCPASEGLQRARQEQKLLELAHFSNRSKA